MFTIQRKNHTNFTGYEYKAPPTTRNRYGQAALSFVHTYMNGLIGFGDFGKNAGPFWEIGPVFEFGTKKLAPLFKMKFPLPWLDNPGPTYLKTVFFEVGSAHGK